VILNNYRKQALAIFIRINMIFLYEKNHSYYTNWFYVQKITVLYFVLFITLLLKFYYRYNWRLYSIVQFDVNDFNFFFQIPLTKCNDFENIKYNINQKLAQNHY
jgi:hypothetical protein